MSKPKATSGKRPAYIPERGDAVWLNFSPQAGREQAGRRPAIVLSPAAYNKKVGLAIVCPITTQQKGYSFEVELPEEGPVTGVVLADQLRSMDWRIRQVALIGSFAPDLVKEVLERALTLIDPDN